MTAFPHPDTLRRRALLARGLGVAAGIAAGAAPAWSATPATPAARGAAMAPMSRRRADDASDTGAQLPAALRALLQGCGLPLHSIGLQVQPVAASATPLARHNAEHAYQLASTAKVVTTLAALDLLGSGWRWRTDACLTGPLAGGVLHGDLVIVGGGDAMLRSADLRQWFARMQADGLREVGGNIVLDHAAFQLDARALANTPTPSPDRPHHAWPDALTVDEGVLRVALRRDLAPLPQEQLTGRVVHAVWLESGGRLRGKVLDRATGNGSGPALAPLSQRKPPWQVRYSEPLTQVLRDINKYSDNLAARNLMLSLAWGFPRRPATLDQAQARVAMWLQRQGLAPGDICVDSGCGLSREERGRPRAMVQLLRRAWVHPQGRAFVDSLPVAGVDGTLQHRMTSGPAAGRAFLKTGTLLDTRALAGYVQGSSGATYALALLVNHPEAQRALPAMDGVVEWVAAMG